MNRKDIKLDVKEEDLESVEGDHDVVDTYQLKRAVARSLTKNNNSYLRSAMNQWNNAVQTELHTRNVK